MKLQVRIPGSGIAVELDCTLSGIGSNTQAVMFEAREADNLVALSFTHTELCSFLMHYREHCDLDDVRQLFGLEKKRRLSVN